jgi:hypothetical protein
MDVDGTPDDFPHQGIAFHPSLCPLIVTNNNNALFSAQPAIAPDGTLAFTPATGATGVATVIVRLRDDGGTADGGANMSAPQSFTITVSPSSLKAPPKDKPLVLNIREAADTGIVQVFEVVKGKEVLRQTFLPDEPVVVNGGDLLETPDTVFNDGTLDALAGFGNNWFFQVAEASAKTTDTIKGRVTSDRVQQ